MPDPPFGPIDPGNNIPPDMSTSDMDNSLDAVANRERKKIFGYNLSPDAGYEFTTLYDDGSLGKPSTLSWYTGLGIKNLNIGAVTAGELPHHSALNLYVPKEGFQTTVIDTEALSDPTDTTQQKPYIDSNFKLNLGESAAMKAANMLGTVFNGTNIGIEDDPAGGLTPVSSFDLRSSLAGRILGGTGAMEDTPIGLIGAQQLGRALQNNILFNLEEETIGRINLNPLSLLTGNDVFTPNYEITVPKGALGKVIDFAARVTGFELPISLLNKQATPYWEDKAILSNNWFPEPTDELVKFTSLGQRAALKENLKKNKFKPTYNKLDLVGESYDTLSDVRKNPNDKQGPLGPLRNVNGKEGLSVLDYNGLVRVGPLKVGDEIEKNPKAYMLSLENLAWADNLALLPEWEIGHGDKLTEKKGRMMWFPPYDITYSEQVNVRWNEELFIGRGEPIFTYNNTSRTVQLSFKIIVDHSSNSNLGSTIQDFTAFTKNIDKLLPPSEEAKRKTKVEDSKVEQIEVSNTEDPIKNEWSDSVAKSYSVFFPNDIYDVKIGYENLESDDLNYKFFNDVEALTAELNKFKDYVKIKLKGFASAAGQDTEEGRKRNVELSKTRGENVKKYLIELGMDSNIKVAIMPPVVSKLGGGDINSLEAKENRVTIIEVEYTPEKVVKKTKPTDKKSDDPDTQNLSDDDIDTIKKAEETKKEDEINKEVVNNLISTRYIDERHYFQYMEENDKFLFNSLAEKLKYFHPAFHSTTPEGLNSRLTFLHQCTRQGASVGDDSDPRNLAFGRPPVCILRLGDFFYTKVIINSLNIGYDTGQWDMNRDGIGLQPMVAKIDLNLAIIGGSSLQGPLSRLQNALSFNYYANTEMYDNRADTIVKDEIGDYKILNGIPSQYEDLTKESIKEQLKIREELYNIRMGNDKLSEDNIDEEPVIQEPAPETFEDVYYVTYIYDEKMDERRFKLVYKEPEDKEKIPKLKDYSSGDFNDLVEGHESGVCKKCGKNKIHRQAKAVAKKLAKEVDEWYIKLYDIYKDNINQGSEDLKIDQTSS